MPLNTETAPSLAGWPELPNILSAKEFQALPPNAKTCIVIEGMTRSGRYAMAQTMSDELGLCKFAFAEWLQKYEPQTDAERNEIARSLKNGTYLPEALSIKIADWALGEFAKKSFCCDPFYNRPFVVVGYPRTLEQAAHFQSFLKKHDTYALVAIIEANDQEAKRRMTEKPVQRIGHESDHVPEVQIVKIGEYYLKTHGFLKWLELQGKATIFKSCMDKKDYERRLGNHLTVTDQGSYVVISHADLSRMIMMFLNMVHFVHYSGA
ncbi:MAG: hypothetical protein HGB19_00710 [Chlorobiales bacterium]|nr:hypothetical protein [Chlorobiales bacterium]